MDIHKLNSGYPCQIMAIDEHIPKIAIMEDQDYLYEIKAIHKLTLNIHNYF